MHKKILITTLLLLFVVPSLGFSVFRENWPTYMGNQYLTGNNDGIIPEGDNVLWKFKVKGRLYNPVGINGRVYVVSTDRNLYCLDIKDGSVIWKFKAEGAITRMVVVYKGRVYLPAGRFLYCLDEKTGKVLWGRRDPSIGFYGTPTIAEGKIFYGNRKGFFCRELQNGHLVWENKQVYTYGGFPSYWNGMVYTVSKEFQKESAFLYALNVADGTRQWSVALPNVSNIYSPVVYDGKVYLAYGNQITVFDGQNGEQILQKFFGSQVASHPVFSQGVLYLSLMEGTIIKIDPDTGNWEPLFSAPYGTQFAAVGSYLFIPIKNTAGGFAIVDAASGKTIDRVTSREGEPSALTVSSGIALVPSTDTLVAFGNGKFLGTVSPVYEEPKTGTRGMAKERAGVVSHKPAPGEEKTETGPALPQPGGTETGGIPKGSAPERGGGEALAGGPKTEKGGQEALTVGPETGNTGDTALTGGPETGSKGETALTEGSETGKGVEETPAGGPGTGRGVEEAPAGTQKPVEGAVTGPETATIRGEVREKFTGRPLSGTVEATTKREDGAVERREKEFSGGSFEIEVPKKGFTDLIVSSSGYTFETITLPDEKAIDDLSTEPLEISLARAETGQMLTVGSIHYRIGSANLEPNSIPTLQNLLQMMQENPSIRITIAGHTDSTGDSAFNKKLSKMRANSVADWLIKNGISSTRLTTVGFGDTTPVASNDTEEGRRKNRRTEITILE